MDEIQLFDDLSIIKKNVFQVYKSGLTSLQASYGLRAVVFHAWTKLLSIFFSLSHQSLLHSAMKDKTASCLYFNINTESNSSSSR